MVSENSNQTLNKAGSKDILGYVLIVFPFLSSVFLWYHYTQSKNGDMTYYKAIIIGTIVITTILATIDSHRLGIKVKIYKRKEIYGGSFLKFFLFLLLWIYTYPIYVYRRKNYNAKGLFYHLLISLSIFIFSAFFLYFAFDSKRINENAYQRRILHYRNSR